MRIKNLFRPSRYFEFSKSKDFSLDGLVSSVKAESVKSGFPKKTVYAKVNGKGTVRKRFLAWED